MWKTTIVLFLISLVPLGCAGQENLNVELINAVKSHDEARVQKLVQKGADVNFKLYGTHGSPLAFCLDTEDFPVAGVLIEHGANVDERDALDFTLLMKACIIGNRKIASFLLKHGAKINLRSDDGYTALFNAAYATNVKKLDPKYTELVKFLIESGAEVDLADNNGYTPLDIAAAKLRYPIIEVLLANGAAINRRAKDGRTPLFYAIANQDPKLLQFLLDKGADPNIVMHNRDYNDLSYLQIAEKLGNKKIIESMKAAGAVASISEP